MRSGQKVVLGVVAVALLVASAGPAQAQRPSYGVEEYNSYVDTSPQATPDPAQRLQVIETFLQKYPDSVLRAFVYPNQAQTAFSVQRYELAMKAVNDFLGMDRGEVEDLYRQSNFNDLQIDNTYYAAYKVYAFSFLQLLANNSARSRAYLDEAKQRAQRGLELHDMLYSQVSPPDDPNARRQFEQQKKQAESAFRSTMAPHAFLANAAWKQKDFAAAAREYSMALRDTPEDPVLNYRLGAANLQKKPAEYREGFWHLARAIALGIPKSDDVKNYLRQAMAAYQQVVPGCLDREVNNLIYRARQSVRPPADWTLISAEAVSALRQAMSVKTIFDGLEKGGPDARLMFLAACGTEIGVGEDGQPELYVKVLDVTQSEDNLVTLRVAAGQEAADAGRANIEVKVVGPPEARELKADAVVRISGKINGYQNNPQFLVELSDGKVHPEDIK